MKLIQLNIWFGKLMWDAISFIQREQPDILCLQEACTGIDFKTPLIGTIKDIQDSCDLPHTFFSPTLDFQYVGHKIDFGNAILSRVPFDHMHTGWTQEPFTHDYDFKNGGNHSRNFQHGIAETPNGPVNLINHHGHLNRPKESDAETDRQIGLIADYIDTLTGPVIVTGDFNLSPEERSIGLLNDRLDNLCISRSAKTTRNQFAWKADEVCDYIFVNDAVKVKDFRVYDDLVSDHAALGLEFEV